MNYWLFKSEPHVFSITDLKNSPKRQGFWDGVRNYQARNYLRDGVKLGDKVLFYHSSTKEPGVVGIATVVMATTPDPTQFDPKSEFFDPKSKKENPTWFGVVVEFEQEFQTIVSLNDIKTHKVLQNMVVAKAGRLSIQPVEKKHFDLVVKLGGVQG